MQSKIYLSIISLLMVLSCKSRIPDSSTVLNDGNDVATHRPKRLEMCAAIRGNGNFIFAHWGAVARLLENYGPIDAVAGGSSASATAFLYESIYMNPAVWDCGPSLGRCSERRAAIRMAFLMKSVREFVSVIGDRVDFNAAALAVPKLVQRFKDKEYASAVANGDLSAAARASLKILQSPELGGIIDTRIIQRLTHALNNKSELKLVMTEIKGAVQALSWDPSNPAILLQRGLIDFEQLTMRIGIAGDFYAGKDAVAMQETKKMLDSCARDAASPTDQDGVGRQWREVVNLPGPEELIPGKKSSLNPWAQAPLITKRQRCGEYFRTVANGFFDRFTKAKKDPQRLSDTVGGTVPTLASTSIFKTVEADNYLRHLYLLFLNNQPYQRGFSSSWINFGYWGQQSDLNEVKKNKMGFSDVKTSRFEALGEVQWGEALRVGPQEPGLGSVLCNYEQGSATKRGKWDSLSNLPEGQQCLRWSLGAWSDLQPVQVLKNLGCERVVYITRRDDESDFIHGVVKLLSSDDQEWRDIDAKLFGLDQEGSSFRTALQNSDAVACSDWNNIEATQLDCLQEDSYRAPILTKDEFFLKLAGAGGRGERLSRAGFKPNKKAVTGPPIRGCMVGAPKPVTKEIRPDPCAVQDVMP